MHRRVQGPEGEESGAPARARMPQPPRRDIERVLALQRGAGNHAVSAMLARLPIEPLKVDTEKDPKEKVYKALMGAWNKTFGLKVTLSEAEAKALLDLFEGELDELLVDELKEFAGISSEDDDKGPSKSKQEKEDSSSEDDDDFFAKKPAKKAAPKLIPKPELGLRFAGVMRGLGHPVFLSGGGAVTMMGSPREIKDLDFRIELPFSWVEEDSEEESESEGPGDALRRRINEAMSKEFDCRVLFNVSDETGHTIKTTFLGVEVSVTRTPKVAYLAHGAPKPGELPRLSGFDLILDKAYSLIMRTEPEKMCSDLFDLLFALRATRGGFKAGCSVLQFLGMQRGEAYRQQRGRRKLDANLIKQLHATITVLLKEDREELERYFKKTGDAGLLDFAVVLLSELERMLTSEPKKLAVL